MKRIPVAVLAFGAVLASVPAFAQSVHYGRAYNDGGMVDVTASPPSKPISQPLPAAPAHYGKALDDGGIVDKPTASAPKVNVVQSSPHVGRALNDGGF
jgi:hypothetical protein